MLRFPGEMECGTLEPDHCCEHPAIVLDTEKLGEALGRIIGDFVFGVARYKAAARAYYFEVMLSNHSCPECGEKLRMTKGGQACCSRGHRLDPTTTFQKSRCCGRTLVKQSLHYSCACCGKTVPSRFLFDERVFDRTYFRQRMAESRAKTRQRREMMRLAQREKRSRSLTLTEEPRVDLLPGFAEALAGFIGFEAGVWSQGFCLDAPGCPGLHAYRRHVLELVARYRQVSFSRIDPLIDEVKRDRAMRFVALVFLLHDGEVLATQYSSDIEIELPYDEID